MQDTAYNKYIEKLLNDHYDASQLLTHELTKGQVRERFIRDQINNQFGGTMLCVSGVLSVRKFKNKIEYKQADLVIFSHQIRKREIGTEYLIDPEDTLLIADIKSTLRSSDIDEWDAIAEKIHKRGKKEKWNKDVQVGLICYRYDSENYTSLLKKFGFRYTKNVDLFNFDKSLQKYKNIDYIFIIHNIDGEDRRLLIRRSEKFPKDKNFIPYIFFKEEAASDNFWMFIQSLTKSLQVDKIKA